MKTFKVIDGKVKVDGVLYSSSPSTDSKIIGKSGGIIHSINITGKGQFFPLSGEFNDGTTPIITTETLEPVRKKGKSPKTELKESSSSAAVDEGGKLVKVKRSKTK